MQNIRQINRQKPVPRVTDEMIRVKMEKKSEYEKETEVIDNILHISEERKRSYNITVTDKKTQTYTKSDSINK